MLLPMFHVHFSCPFCIYFRKLRTFVWFDDKLFSLKTDTRRDDDSARTGAAQRAFEYLLRNVMWTHSVDIVLYHYNNCYNSLKSRCSSYKTMLYIRYIVQTGKSIFYWNYLVRNILSVANGKYINIVSLHRILRSCKQWKYPIDYDII